MYKEILKPKYFKSGKSFEELKKQMIKDDITKTYSQAYIKKQLVAVQNLRLVFFAVIRFNPAIISEITDMTFLCKSTCYRLLSQLRRFKMIHREFVYDKESGKLTKNKSVARKWKELSKRMPEGSHRHFVGRTSMFLVTEFGKQFLEHAMQAEQEFKEDIRDDLGDNL